MTPSKSFAADGAQTACAPGRDDSTAEIDAARPRRTGRLLFAIWALISLIWTGTVVADLFYRATAQADMSQEVERDLDPVACVGPGCAPPQAMTPQERWADVAETYVQFGYVSLLEWAMVPPVILLVAGAGALMLVRRRREF